MRTRLSVAITRRTSSVTSATIAEGMHTIPSMSRRALEDEEPLCKFEGIAAMVAANRERIIARRKGWQNKVAEPPSPTFDVCVEHELARFHRAARTGDFENEMQSLAGRQTDLVNKDKLTMLGDREAVRDEAKQ